MRVRLCIAGLLEISANEEEFPCLTTRLGGGLSHE